jgi:hypothetical protein
MASWSISWLFGIFFPVLVCGSKKNLATPIPRFEQSHFVSNRLQSDQTFPTGEEKKSGNFFCPIFFTLFEIWEKRRERRNLRRHKRQACLWENNKDGYRNENTTRTDRAAALKDRKTLSSHHCGPLYAKSEINDDIHLSAVVVRHLIKILFPRRGSGSGFSTTFLFT